MSVPRIPNKKPAKATKNKPVNKNTTDQNATPNRARSQTHAQSTKQHQRVPSKALPSTLAQRYNDTNTITTIEEETKLDEKIISGSRTDITKLAEMKISDLVPDLSSKILHLENADISLITDPEANLVRTEVRKILEKDLTVENYLFMVDGMDKLRQSQNNAEDFLHALKALYNNFLLNRDKTKTGTGFDNQNTSNASKSFFNYRVNLYYGPMQNLRKAIITYDSLTKKPSFNENEIKDLKFQLMLLKTALNKAASDIFGHIVESFDHNKTYQATLNNAAKTTMQVKEILAYKNVALLPSVESVSQIFSHASKIHAPRVAKFFQAIENLLQEKVDTKIFKEILASLLQEYSSTMNYIKTSLNDIKQKDPQNPMPDNYLQALDNLEIISKAQNHGTPQITNKKS